ncbi:MAG: MFS transporter [Betaproteobacteria bacterium]|nr:MFS transporter [Betaproteobacteria bacterium]
MEPCAQSADAVRRAAILLITAHVVSMLGFSSFAALLPELRDLWGLSNAQAGVIGGAFFFGYAGTVSYWTALTDRRDARRVYLTGSLLATAGSAGFGLLAEGFASALLFQALLGAGIAATYMPGLRLLSDRVAGPAQSRYVAFYTSFFGIGTALSLALAGAVAPLAGWRTAFVLSALGPAIAGALVFAGVARQADRNAPHAAPRFSPAMLFPLAAWRRVLADRAAAGYTLGYAVHCMELFGSRAWLVAYFVYSAGLHAPGAGFPWPAALMASIITLWAVPASILGNEVALRIGRRRWILLVMASSGSLGIVLGLGAAWSWILVLALVTIYAMLVMAESATLTAGLVAAAPAELRGAAMGFYSLAGFAGGMLGPMVFGAALDWAGGAQHPGAWIVAFAAIGAGCLAAAPLARLFGRAGRA